MELLLCTNGSTNSRNALQIGVRLAVVLRYPVTLLGIVESQQRRQEVEAQIDEALDKLRTADIGADILLTEGDAQQVIPEQAQQADYLVVVGALEHRPLRRLLRGPTMRHLLEAVNNPMLCIYHAPPPDDINRILICSGGLNHADAAIHLGGQLASAFGASVTLLHVAAIHAYMPAHLVDLPASEETYLEQETLYAQNLKQSMAYLEEVGLAVDFQLRSGEPLLEILHVIRDSDYDLVVIGSHAAVTGPAQLVGNNTNRIVEGAGRPVLVVKTNPY